MSALVLCDFCREMTPRESSVLGERCAICVLCIAVGVAMLRDLGTDIDRLIAQAGAAAQDEKE